MTVLDPRSVSISHQITLCLLLINVHHGVMIVDRNDKAVVPKIDEGVSLTHLMERMNSNAPAKTGYKLNLSKRFHSGPASTISRLWLYP